MKKINWLVLMIFSLFFLFSFNLGINSPGKSISSSIKSSDLTNSQLVVPVNLLSQEATNSILPEIFPLGWYDGITYKRTAGKVAKEGINLLIPYTVEKDDETVTGYLDAAKVAGVKVILELRRSTVKAGDVIAVKQFVHKFKTHPSVFGWYLYDEPANNNISPNTLNQLYDAIKEEDPEKPVAIAFAWYTNMVEYINAMDIFMFDYYPCYYGSPEFAGFGGNKFQEYLTKAAYYGTKKDAFWFIMQGFGENNDGTPQIDRRLPTEAEARYMFYTSILAGADGLFFWAHYRSQQSWIDSVLTPIVQEFQEYIFDIKNGILSNQINVNRSEIQVALYQNSITSRYLLVAINHSQSSVNTIFQISEDIQANSVELRTKDGFQNLHLTSDNTLYDLLPPYTVNIYEIR